MARRPAAEKNPGEAPFTLEKAFETGLNPSSAQDSGAQAGAGDQAEVQVGKRLRELRRQRKLSIRALAAISGLAINTLSMIEKGKTSPSVSTLQILARTLETPITAFFEQDTVEKQVVYVRCQQRPIATVDSTRLEHLGKDLAGSPVQPFVVTLQPGCSSGKSMIVHTGHEFVYCLSGQVRYVIEDEVYPLNPGDSIIFESHLSHCWENTSSQPAQIILILIPSDSRDTPAERHFPLD